MGVCILRFQLHQIPFLSHYFPLISPNALRVSPHRLINASAAIALRVESRLFSRSCALFAPMDWRTSKRTSSIFSNPRVFLTHESSPSFVSPDNRAYSDFMSPTNSSEPSASGARETSSANSKSKSPIAASTYFRYKARGIRVPNVARIGAMHSPSARCA